MTTEAVQQATEAIAKATEPAPPPPPDIAPMLGTRANIHQRINAVKQAVRYVRKTKLVGKESSSYSYKAIERDEVMAILNPYLTRHGINVGVSFVSGESLPSGTFTANEIPIIRFEGVFDVSLVNADDPNDQFVQRVSAHALDQGDKAPGKAATYAEKTALVKGFSLETGIDEESRYDDIQGPAQPAGERIRPKAKEPEKVEGKPPAKEESRKAPAKAPAKAPEKAAEPGQKAPPGEPPPGEPPPGEAVERAGDTRQIMPGQVKFLQAKMKGLARNDKHAAELWKATLIRHKLARLEDATVEQASKITDEIKHALKLAGEPERDNQPDGAPG